MTDVSALLKQQLAIVYHLSCTWISHRPTLSSSLQFCKKTDEKKVVHISAENLTVPPVLYGVKTGQWKQTQNQNYSHLNVIYGNKKYTSLGYKWN
jgi:hypothetical protein